MYLLFYIRDIQHNNKNTNMENISKKKITEQVCVSVKMRKRTAIIYARGKNSEKKGKKLLKTVIMV